MAILYQCDICGISSKNNELKDVKIGTELPIELCRSCVLRLKDYLNIKKP